MLHQQVVGSSEHQIRLSKGLTAKFVLPLELATAKAGTLQESGRCVRSVELKKPPLRWLFGILGVAVLLLYF
jgi:hypothetical protein